MRWHPGVTLRCMSTLDAASLARALGDLPGWTRDGDALAASFRRKDWADALAFVNEIGAEAERRNHHPDVCITGYRTVTIRLTTHSEGGVTGRDTAFAAWCTESAASR
jgi:4a-hydroxytetrahydrobiopterin dehydratase